MPNRLQPINVADFVGGLNLRRNQFQLADNESPDLLNVDIDPRGGFHTRKGWKRWNTDDEIVDLETTLWQPRNAFIHVDAAGIQRGYVANVTGAIYTADSSAEFSLLAGVTGAAINHKADFASWGDALYIATGVAGTASYRRIEDGAIETLTSDTYSEIDAPTGNMMPRAEHVESHAGYLFVGMTIEGTEQHHARIRWSHPSKPDSWRADDFIDIEANGGRITAMISFEDHLLIFKSTSVWALYGYDDESWQLVWVSSLIGCPGNQAVTRSETATYFFSAVHRGGVYVYQDGAIKLLSEPLTSAFEEITAFNNVFVSWAGRRLWVAVPWLTKGGPTAELSSVFVYDTDVGDGAWTLYHSPHVAVATVLNGYDVNQVFPLAAVWSTEMAGLVTLDAIDDAYDMLLLPPVLGATPPSSPPEDISYLVTGADEEIGTTGEEPEHQMFDAYYRTRWLHAGWPDRKKSWRRPTFICREVPRDVDLLVEAYRDYNETNIHRSKTLHVVTSGGSFWTELGADDPDVDGFDWTVNGATNPRGANWSQAREGSSLVRGGSMGLARAVQVKVGAAPNTPGRKWGVDAIVAKIVPRRFH